MTTVLQNESTTKECVLYIALELSQKNWKLGLSNGEKVRIVSLEAGDWLRFDSEIERALEKLGLAADCRKVSCYEAGRDGFWVHRSLEGKGIDNLVVDSASIEVNRRQRRTKTDRVDVQSLVRLLQRYWGGERQVMSVVRVPTAEQEDQRRLHRERERLVKERGSHSTRIKALLAAQGIRLDKVDDEFLVRLERFGDECGKGLGTELKGELAREYQRYCLVAQQIRGLEEEQKRRCKEATGEALWLILTLRQLKGVGWQSSWILVMEFFAWRGFKNGRQLAACSGLAPTPYASGDSQREQGISKAGSRRIRRVMVELSWLWLRYQPDSTLSRWFWERFGHGGKRMRRIGIVALARKLLIALWRFGQEGIIPEGAVLKSA